MNNWFVKKVKEYIPNTFENLKVNKTKILQAYKVKTKKKDVIVSMTTYEPRVNVFEYAVLSILAGSVLPEKILIYVPKGFKNLVLNNPNSFIKDELDFGLINLIEMDEDLGPHSKYYYSFQEFGQEKDIVLCDDDVVYYQKWLENLVLAADKYSTFSVFGYKIVNVKVKNEVILPYDEWIHLFEGHKAISNLLYAEGVGGVFYRRGVFNKEVLNKKAFEELAPKADDVWLWFCAYLNNAKIMHILPSSNRLLYVIPSSQVVNLWSENTTNKRNDTYVENCRKYFLDKYNMNIISYA